MLLVNVSVERTAQAILPVLDPARVVAALNAVATTADDLEHITTRAEPSLLRIGMFFRCTDRPTAQLRANRICRDAFQRDQQFAGWRLTDGSW
ncbi:hypothetical protein [Dactylosporangium sp. NPDC000521]|uniref:hypothetical protein n=1 Tax=Dactylosporangium sp. NPDC000521 TaxID=3363975 RepID=UPI0036A8B434